MNSQFDLALGIEAKQEGIATVEAHEGTDFLEVIRTYAVKFARTHGSVTSDDLRRYAMSIGWKPHHPNTWGAVFRDRRWKSVGRVKSKKISNHARWIHVWEWKEV